MGMFGFRRGDLAEPVPKGYENLTLPPAWHEIRPQSVSEVDKLCRMLGADPKDQFNPRTIEGCAPWSIHAVIYPADDVLDREATQVLRDHEVLHAYGAVHGSGARGWANLPAPEFVNALRSGLLAGISPPPVNPFRK